MKDKQEGDFLVGISEIEVTEKAVRGGEGKHVFYYFIGGLGKKVNKTARESIQI